jgi:hypothetical protein
MPKTTKKAAAEGPLVDTARAFGSALGKLAKRFRPAPLLPAEKPVAAKPAMKKKPAAKRRRRK